MGKTPYLTTDTYKATKFVDEETAMKRLISSGGKSNQNKFHVVNLRPSAELVPQSELYKKVDINNLKKKISIDFDTVKIMMSNHKLLEDKLKEIELIKNDLNHLIEFNRFNLVDGYKVYRLQHILFKKRREIKDQIKHIEFLECAKVTDLVSGKMDELFNELDGRKYLVRTDIMKPLFKSQHISSSYIKDFQEKVESIV